MNGPGPDIDPRLEASLRRIARALERNRSVYGAVVGQIMAATGAEVAERISAKTEHIVARTAQRHERRVERWERRRARREAQREREAASGVPRGIVFALAAIACLAVAIAQPGLFWMVFVGLGLGMSAVGSFSQAAAYRRRARESSPEVEAEDDRVEAKAPAAAAESVTPPPIPRVPAAASPADPPDPKVARIQALCDKLLAELESGPPVVREVVTEPQTTIGGLRQACVATARRERELRTVLGAQDEAALISERDALAARVAGQSDAIVRDRLGQALAALEQQLAHRAELTTAATRLEAENTRILYTLENLHMQLLRARTTDLGGPELGGKLRDSLRELGTQIDAVAEALEYASAPAGAEVTPDRAERERAERAAAARRAAQSQRQ